ncbi:hypothetical protein [Aliiroseovarius subalbicans]|uniref:hypothetical protein n=1 Tax=Aliiroseovarius subalbicans TaxID=2925840 RepID=UPI001F562A56|nr:hypothetical protein [Aliiroseovarius subalbicans]MCI2399366.1 hypothetical protein [Aliiroseovarius subalbicans]
MMIADSPAPEKVYLLLGELLRDDGIEEPTRENIACLLGYALTFAHINIADAEEEDARDKQGPAQMAEDAIATAFAYHEHYREAASGLRM